MVHVGLRLPVHEHQLPHVLGVLHVHGEGVAVVVVADVLVVEPGQRAALVLGAQVLHVVVVDHDRAVRIEGRDLQVHDVVEDPPRLLVGPRHEVVGQLRRHVDAAHLARVHAHRLADDDLALGHDPFDLRLGHAPRIAQLEVHLPQFLEPGLVGRRGDDDQQERVAHLGGPHVDDLELAAALFLKQLVVFDCLVPADEFPVGAHLEAEELLRRRDLRLGLRDARRHAGGREHKGERHRRRGQLSGESVHESLPGGGPDAARGYHRSLG